MAAGGPQGTTERVRMHLPVGGIVRGTKRNRGKTDTQKWSWDDPQIIQFTHIQGGDISKAFIFRCY